MRIYITADQNFERSIHRENTMNADPTGAESLGAFFLEGEFKDTERAVAYLKKAYELGSLRAGTRLGRFLYNEAGSPQQREEAKALLSSLSEQNYIPAVKALAVIYSSGNTRMTRRLKNVGSMK